MRFFHEVAMAGRSDRLASSSPGRPSGNVLPRSSVAPVYRFLLMLPNGEAADPPAFLTEQSDWKPGDVFVARGHGFRIVDTDAEIGVAGMILFDAICRCSLSKESRT
jgi:hypothetical protein